MKMLHCLYDHPRNPWVGGGAARRLGILRRHLEDMGHDVDVITGSFPGCQDVESDDARYEFVGSSAGYMLSTFSYARAARREVIRRSSDYDLVIEDFAPWNPLFIHAADIGPKLIQLQSHLGGEILRKYLLLGLPFYYFEKNYPRKFAERISISRQIGDFPTGHTQIIPNGVDADSLNGKPKQGSYIGFMGRLDYKIKGIDTLLKAARISKLPIKIAGDGPDKERLQRDIAPLANVEWTGWLRGSAMMDFLKEAKFMVAPSRSEGQNMVVMDAAALSKCSVVSDIDGLRYVTDAGFGLAFPMESAEALASHMKTLWENDEMRSNLARAAREYVRDMTWPKLANSFAAYCQEVVDRYQSSHCGTK